MNGDDWAKLIWEILVWAHIVSGSIGLVSLWVPVVARKGGAAHRSWGRVFGLAMLATGTLAVGIAITTLIAPLPTHPFSDDAAWVRGLFGWMMLYLGTMTVALAWHGVVVLRNKRDHARNRAWPNIALQGAMIGTALNCALYGVAIGEYLMVGIAVPGTVAGVLNTWFLRSGEPLPKEWLIQHFRGMIGAGISVYTAFLAFGAVKLLPAAAFNPVLWALPTVLGVPYMMWHNWKVVQQQRQTAVARGDRRSVARAEPTTG